MRKLTFGKPMIGIEEMNAVTKVLKGPILVHGPKAEEFEAHFAKFTGAKNAVSVSSCTAGMHLAYFNLGIGPGHEVIVPAQTHSATVHAVELCGARPVFVDAEKETGNIDIDQIESCITPNTRAIAVVHFLGMPVAMDKVCTIAKRHHLFVLEDCALSLGSYYKNIHTGLHGDVGCFSFYPIKHMTTAEGGMFITQNDAIAVDIRRKKAFGVDRTALERSIPGVYDVNTLGLNYRMSELQAAIGIEQLKRVPHFLEKRKNNYDILAKGLREIDEIDQFKSSHDDFHSGYYCLSILLKDKIVKKRFDIVAQLKENGVGTSVYYPRPVPHMTYYKEKYNFKESDFPVAARISYGSVALPVGPHLDEEDMQYIIEMVKRAIRQVL